ncbi:MAG: hypothetical protein NC209_00755, partial [Alistipes sp.]|nr:hypothetical protein [Alistipes senegalensis]MCM1249663.1 hypothetical protein [Alistipes sp.]
WCMMYESLRNGKHGKGSHGYGGIWGGAPASFHHNILAHHDSRNPRFDGPDAYVGPDANPRFPVSERCVDYRNNLVYNFCDAPASGGEGLKINFAGNLYKWGPASVGGAGSKYASDGEEIPDAACRRAFFYRVDGIRTAGGIDYDYGAADIYYGDCSNLLDTSVGDPMLGAAVSDDNARGFPLNENTLSLKKPEATFLAVPLPIRPDGRSSFVTTHDASQLSEVLCLCAGACAGGRRDAADSRVISDLRGGMAAVMQGSNGSRNGLVDSPADVGGWPALTATPEELSRVRDSDGDGIPDCYEELFGLDRENPADANEKTLDPRGRYTNLEIYLHYLVREITAAQTHGGVYTEL